MPRRTSCGVQDAPASFLVIENRAGAGGNIAAEAVLRASADGYTLLVNTTPNIASPPLPADEMQRWIRGLPAHTPAGLPPQPVATD